MTLAEQGLARRDGRQGHNRAKNLIGTLCNQELDAVGRRLASETGLAVLPTEAVSTSNLPVSNSSHLLRPLCDDLAAPRLPTRALDSLPLTRAWQASADPLAGPGGVDGILTSVTPFAPTRRGPRCALPRQPARPRFCLGHASSLRMSATKILWGQLLFVLAGCRLRFSGRRPNRTAWRLVFPVQLGPAWFVIDLLVYQPLAFFIWWFKFDATHRRFSLRAGASPQVVGSQPRLLPSSSRVWRAKEAQNVTTYGSARWADIKEVSRAGLSRPQMGRARSSW